MSETPANTPETPLELPQVRSIPSRTGQHGRNLCLISIWLMGSVTTIFIFVMSFASGSIDSAIGYFLLPVVILGFPLALCAMVMAIIGLALSARAKLYQPVVNGLSIIVMFLGLTSIWYVLSLG